MFVTLRLRGGNLLSLQALCPGSRGKKIKGEGRISWQPRLSFRDNLLSAVLSGFSLQLMASIRWESGNEKFYLGTFQFQTKSGFYWLKKKKTGNGYGVSSNSLLLCVTNEKSGQET